jgi:hypothetical protein
VCYIVRTRFLNIELDIKQSYLTLELMIYNAESGKLWNPVNFTFYNFLRMNDKHIQENICKYSPEYTCNVQFIKRMGSLFYISDKFTFYSKHFLISISGQSHE